MKDTSDVFALAKDLRVLVTAGASGIGRAIGDLLAARGARLHICDVSDDFLADYRAAHRDARVTKPPRLTSLVSSARSRRRSADSMRSSTMPASPVRRAAWRILCRRNGGAPSTSA